MESFTNKGRFRRFLEKIPVHVILNDKTALIGAAYFAIMVNNKIRWPYHLIKNSGVSF